MLYIVLDGSELVGVMTSPVDAALIAKPLQAQVWTCQPNSTDATLVTDPILPSDRPSQAVPPIPYGTPLYRTAYTSIECHSFTIVHRSQLTLRYASRH